MLSQYTEVVQGRVDPQQSSPWPQGNQQNPQQQEQLKNDLANIIGQSSEAAFKVGVRPEQCHQIVDRAVQEARRTSGTF